MNTPDKCPHCGAEVPEYAPAGFYSCGSSVGIEFHQSDFCRERAANGKPTGEPNPNGSTNARLNWWKQRCDALSDELTHERAAHAETRKSLDAMRESRDETNERLAALNEWLDCHKGELDKVKAQLTREREKWGKLRVWASDKFWLNRAIVIKEMNRLDAEANEEQR